MNTRHLRIAGTAGPRIDGIDVAQLLHVLGEASAASSAVDLFGLCLSAQRVLAYVHATSAAGSPVQAEAALLSTYRAMNPAGCDRLRSFAGHLQKRFPRQLPVLTLVEGSQGRPGHGFSIDVKTRIEGAIDGQ